MLPELFRMRWTLTGPHPLSDLLRNLWAACLLLVFRRSALRWLVPTPLNFLVLLLLSLSVSFTFDLLSEGWPGEWSPAGVAVYLLPGFALLVFGQVYWQPVMVCGDWDLAPASVWLAADSLLGLAQCLLLYAGQHEWLPPDVAQPCARDLPAAVCLARVCAGAGFYAGVSVANARTAFWHSRHCSWFFCSLWTLTYSATSDSGLRMSLLKRHLLLPRVLVKKRRFTRSRSLLQRALTAIAPERPQQVDWYFLGVGRRLVSGRFPFRGGECQNPV
jgi:hypothetical protein